MGDSVTEPELFAWTCKDVSAKILGFEIPRTRVGRSASDEKPRHSGSSSRLRSLGDVVSDNIESQIRSHCGEKPTSSGSDSRLSSLGVVKLLTRPEFVYITERSTQFTTVSHSAKVERRR